MLRRKAVHIPWTFRPQVNSCRSPLAPYLRRHEARPFSLAAAIESGYIVTHETMAALHAATGLPWVWTFPLVALCVRTITLLPIEVWARKHRYRASQARPILSARQPIVQSRIRRENPNLSMASQRKLFLMQMRTERIKLWKSLGIKSYPAFMPLVQLPIWLLLMETVRKMCGAPHGLLGLIFQRESSAAGEETVVQAVTSSPLFEPGLATEGAFWFPDLLVKDPQLILPFMLSAVLFTNVARGVRQQRAEGIEPAQGVSKFTRFLQVFSLAVGPLTLSMPAAMHVYWISSSSCAILHDWILRYAYPRPPSVTPCKGTRGAASAPGAKDRHGIP
jgi:mitochondrial inner membrane protein COX18